MLEFSDLVSRDISSELVNHACLDASFAAAPEETVAEEQELEVLDVADVTLAPEGVESEADSFSFSDVNIQASRINILDSYVKDARRHKPLTREEEAECYKLAAAGDGKQRSKMINSNLLLVVRYAHRFKRMTNNLLDLIQEGNMGLMRAFELYDPSRGTRFTTYAGWWIEAFMLKYILKNSNITKANTTAAQKKLFWALRREQDRLQKLGAEATTELIAENLKVKQCEVEEMDVYLRGEVSMDAPVGFDDDAVSHGEMLNAQPETRPDNMLELEDFKAVLRFKLEAFGSKITDEREKVIFFERLLADDELTLQEIADRFGITRQRVQQIEQGVSSKLRTYLRDVVIDNTSNDHKRKK